MDDELISWAKEFTKPQKPQGGGISSSKASALQKAADDLGVDAADLGSIISFESAGSFNPHKVGGEGNRYKGLIQFGPAEQQKYYKPNDTFESQVQDGVVRYFRDRFKQAGKDTRGATLEDLYTTVIAGNPKANRDAKDSFGTSARSGAQRILKEHRPKVIKDLFGGIDTYIPDDELWGKVDSALQTDEDVWGAVDQALEPRVQPTKELDATIQGQMQSANDPNVKTRFGVLATEPEQATLFANQPNFKPFETKEGTLWLNTAKIYKDKKLKLKNEKDLQQYLKNPKALTTLIGVAEDVGNETRGTAVRAKDPKTGVELATGVVTNPVSAVEQAQNYKDQFPNAEIEVTDTDVVTDERKRMAAQVLDDPRQLGGEFAEAPAELKDREALQPVDTTAIDAMMRAPQRGQVQTPVVKVPTRTVQRPTKGKPVQRTTQPERRRDSSLSGITSVPIEDIPTENIDNFLSRQALTDAARRQGLGGDAVDAFLASRGGNILQTGTQPYTAEEIASYKDRGVKKIEVSFDKGLEDDFRRFATDYTEAKTKDANEQLARQELRANIDEKNRGTNKQLSFTDPLTWKMAWDELWKGNWSGTITEEDRQSAIDNAVAEQVKNAGSAGERLRLDEEYKNLSNFDKGVAHVGDIYNTIQRAPASFAKTAAWIEDTTGYLREKGIILPWVTTTDIAQGLDWIASKTLGLQPSDIKQGALPTLFADVVEKIYPDDKRTANTMMGKIARGTGSAVPFLLGAMATGGGSVATGLLGAGMQVGEMYDTAKKEGLSREKQLLSGALGIPIGASEAWGLKWAKLGELINNRSKGVFLKSFTNWLKETGKDATEEALQEFFQSTASKLTITALKNNGLTFKDVTNAIGDSVEDAAVGAIVGTLFGGGAPLAVKAGEKATAPVTKARTDALLKTEPEASVEPVTEPIQQETPKTQPTTDLKGVSVNKKGETTYAGETKTEIEERRRFERTTANITAQQVQNLADDKEIDIATVTDKPLAEMSADELRVTTRAIEAATAPRKVAPERKSVFEDTFDKEVPVEKPKKKIKPTVTTEVTEEPVKRDVREVANDIATAVQGTVVGSASKTKTTPKDIDIKIEGEYDKANTEAKMSALGYEFVGSSVIDPKEARLAKRKYGKTFGDGWSRIQHFQNAKGKKVDIFHSLPDVDPKALVEQPVEKVVEKPTPKAELIAERDEKIAEIEADAKELEATGKVIEAKNLRQTITPLRMEYKKKLISKPDVIEKGQNVNIKQPSVDSVNISDLPDGTKVTYTKADGTVVNGTMATDKFGRVVSIGDATRSVKLPWKPVDEPMMMIAWHGSPHKFDKFDSSKIGTGEGAQAYGHGLYFTDQESVAQYYKDALTQPTVDGKTLDSWLYRNDAGDFDNRVFDDVRKEMQRGDTLEDAVEEVVSQLESRLESETYDEDTGAYDSPSAFDALRQIKLLKKFAKASVVFPQGAKYKVQLTPENNEYLLWDKPLNEQASEAVTRLRDGLEQEVADESEMSDIAEAILDNEDLEGKVVYGELVKYFGNQSNASDYLKSLGIRGIKYLDGSSRSIQDLPRRTPKGEWEVGWHSNKRKVFKDYDEAVKYAQEVERNYNYVIFDDADVEIEEMFKRPVEGSPEFAKATELANLPKRGEKFLEGVKTTAKEGFIDLSPEAVEMGRIIDKAVGRSEGIRYGTTYTKAEAIDHIEGAKDLRQVLKDKGMSTKAIDKYIVDFEKVAKENQGIVPVGIEASRKHETLHGADLKSRIVNGETITTTKESDAVAKNPTFKKFHDKLNEIVGKKLSTESAMAEAVAYLGDGDYKQFGLTIKEAASVLADIGIARFNSLVEAYDGDVEKAKANMAAFNIEGGEKIYEAIKSTDNGKGVRPSTESGQKREGESETVGSQDVGNAEKAGQGKASEAKTESDGLKIRQYSESLRDAGFVDSPLVPYIPGTDAQKAAETNRIIETSDPMMRDAEKMFYAKGTDPKLKGVLGTALIDHLGSIGEITRMLKVATDTVEYIGTAAQVLQAAKLVAKYDFASGLMMAQKAANKAGRDLTEREVENIKVKLEKIAVTTENQATLEYVVEELKTAIKAKDIEIANRDKALAEANTYREATDAELAKLKKQLAHKKPQTTREKLKESHAAREAAIRAQFRDTMMMAVGGEPKFDLKQNLIDEATLDIFDGKTPEQMVRHLQELTNNTLSDAEIADIHLKAWDATGYKTKPTTLDELTAEDKETRLALRERAKARREHIRAINDLKGVQKQSNYEIEVIEYGRANGYTDGEIAGALYIPKVKGENAVEQWKKKIEGEFGKVNFNRAFHLRRVANANIKANQLEARHEREQYQGDLKAFENHLSRGRTASAVAKSEFTSYAQKVGRGWVKKIAHAVTETVAATKGLSTWGEISYILRQGFVPLITDTRNAVKGDWQGVGHGLQGDNVMWQKMAGKAGLDNIAQYLSDHNVSMFIDRIRQHPSFGDAQRHGIRFTQIGDFNIADDHFSVKALEVIPLYKRTEYAYTLPGDLQRLYMFDAWSKVIDGQGLDVIQTKRAKKYAAETINAFTGKGDVKRILASNGAFAKLLNLTFFSPQLLISRFQTLNRLSTGFATAPKGMKWQMAKKGMRFYGVVGLIALLTGMVLDPDDDDFGTIRIKVGDRDMRDTRVNILAGLDVPAQLYMRTAMGFAKSLVSNDIAYVGDAMKANMTDFVLDKRQTPRFARSKLSPGASFGYDWLDGKDFIGRPTTLWGSVTSRVAPLSWQQVYDAFLYDRYKEMVKEPRDLQYGINKAVTHEQKMTNAIVTMVASFLGMGITQYPKDDPSQALQLARQLSPAVSKKDEETLRQEGGLRNLLKAQLTEQGEERDKAKAAVQRWLQQYPALRAEMAKLQSQVKSKTGLLAYYGKDLNADQLRRVREKATDVDEIKLIDSMIKRATKQKVATAR